MLVIKHSATSNRNLAKICLLYVCPQDYESRDPDLQGCNSSINLIVSFLRYFQLGNHPGDTPYYLRMGYQIDIFFMPCMLETLPHKRL